ncbi:hypothetical protein niasHT_035693 [Heterodera trifolii]|uniref:Uncharacterized protein n=1 Tax=Heterodera trifolii TaxID=157864 RepID=A0ABD2I3P0_9BILA
MAQAEYGGKSSALLGTLTLRADKNAEQSRAQDPYISIREGERIYGQQGRRVPPNGIDEKNAGERAEKALGDVREGIESAEAIGVSHGRQRRESLLGLDVPYKVPSTENQQQQNDEGQQKSKDGILEERAAGRETEKQPVK